MCVNTLFYFPLQVVSANVEISLICKACKSTESLSTSEESCHPKLEDDFLSWNIFCQLQTMLGLAIISQGLPESLPQPESLTYQLLTKRTKLHQTVELIQLL